jgi:hypothetical protein
LLVQRHELTAAGAPRRAARLGQADERRQPERLGLVGQHFGQYQREMQRLGGQRFDRRPGRPQLPIDRPRTVYGLQHGGQSLVEVRAGRNHEWDVRVANPAFRADQALRQRHGWQRERARDGRRVDAEHRLQHQRGAAVGGDRRMRTDQHQLQAAIGNRLRILGIAGVIAEFPCRTVLFGQRAGHPVGMRLPPVAQAVAGHGQNPGVRTGRYPLDGPTGQRALQRVADGVLGRGDVGVRRGQHRQQPAVGAANQFGHPGLRLTQGRTIPCRSRK